jgi:DNA-directed RNA polymerase sigma subunit (sigma70/sigma32)
VEEIHKTIKQNPISLDEEIGEEGDSNLHNFIPDNLPSPFELMERKSFRKRLLEIMEKLSTEEKEIIIMRF